MFWIGSIRVSYTVLIVAKVFQQHTKFCTWYPIQRSGFNEEEIIYIYEPGNYFAVFQEIGDISDNG